MTEEHTASRTIVKSPPELWAECSVAASLARHLGEYGEIKITRLEPETTVAWEGEHASGTVRLEPAGWGTQVTLTASVPAPEPDVADVAAPELLVGDPGPLVAEPSDVAEPEPLVAEPEPVVAEPEPLVVEPEPLVAERDEPEVEEPEVDVDPSDEQLPRWQLFARLWSKLGRKPSPADEEDDEEVQEFVAEAAAAEEPFVEEHFAAEFAAEEFAAEEFAAEGFAADEFVADEFAAEELGATQAVGGEPVAPEPAPPAIDHQALLAEALDSLGQAHHRPFSRA